MAKPKISEEALLNGWELEESEKLLTIGAESRRKPAFPFFLARYDGYGPLARLGFRSRQAALAFAMGNPAPRNSREAGRYMKGI